MKANHNRKDPDKDTLTLDKNLVKEQNESKSQLVCANILIFNDWTKI